jgi:hypothetical protein
VGQLDLVTSERLVNGFGIERLCVRSGMGVNFRQTSGQPFEDLEKYSSGHSPSGAKTMDLIAERNGMTAQVPQSGAAQEGENMAEDVAWRWLAHEAHEVKAVRDSNWNREPQNRGMKVQKLVPVAIRRRETQGAERFELARDFRSQIRFERAPKEIAQASLRWRDLESRPLIRKPRTFCSATGAECQMKPDAKPRMLDSKTCRFCGVRLVHHQTRLRKKASGVLKDDCFVDARTAAKIVASEDQIFQSIRQNLQEPSRLGRITSADNS